MLLQLLLLLYFLYLLSFCPIPFITLISFLSLLLLSFAWRNELLHLDGRANFCHIFYYFSISGSCGQGLFQRLIYSLLNFTIGQLIGEKFIPICTIFGVFGQHFSKESLYLCWYYWFFGECKFFLLDHEDELGDAAAFEGTVTEQHAEQNHSQ